MPEPNQQNPKATVGVEVPEEAKKAVAELLARDVGWFDLAEREASCKDDAAEATYFYDRAAELLAAAVPHITPAIRNEEREKVLGEVRAAGKRGEVRDVAREAVAREIDDGCGCDQCLATVAVEAALASLPLDAMEEPPDQCEQCGHRRRKLERIDGEWICATCKGQLHGWPNPDDDPQPPDSLDRGGEAE